MKPASDWHRTPLGRALLFLGGVRFAVPVLMLVAAALAWGTWIESSGSALDAKRIVYGSWWFIALMLLVCLSLVLSVVTRLPWHRKHTGFIVVHASLVMLIASAFLSFFTRVEGRVVLAEGDAADTIQLETTQIDVFRHQDGAFTLEHAALLDDAGELSVAGIPVRIEERWANSTQEFKVTDDGSNPLHAVELRPSNGDPVWIGQTDPSAAPQDLGGVFVHVLPEGHRWTPPAPASEAFFFTTEGEQIGIPPVGSPIGDAGWTIVSAERFARATIDTGTLTERDRGPANPAFMLHLAHTDGSRERHIAFERFPDSVHKTTLEGESHSPYALRLLGATRALPQLIFERADGVSTAIIVDAAGTERFVKPDATDWAIDSGIVGAFAVLNEFTHARGSDRLVEAPAGENTQPALVIAYTLGDHTHTAILPWMQRVPLQFGDEIHMLRYAPTPHELPFAIELAEFRKTDYPGTMSAMAYESDVLFTLPDADPVATTISMNRPLEHAGWKVYQSGFLGDTISIFQVTRDPGLVPTYIACTALCVGIMITFYSRSMSRGHPGIRTPFANQTLSGGGRHEAASRHPVPLPVVAARHSPAADPDGGPGGAADPAPGEGDALVHVCAARRGAADRPHKMA